MRLGSMARPRRSTTDGSDGVEQALRHRFEQPARMGVFAKMMEGLATKGTGQKTIMIEATYLKAHRTASSLRAKKGA
jgi:hypothetical protein